MPNTLGLGTVCIRVLLQIVAQSQKRGEGALTEKREKVMLELDKLQR